MRTKTQCGQFVNRRRRGSGARSYFPQRFPLVVWLGLEEMLLVSCWSSQEEERSYYVRERQERRKAVVVTIPAHATASTREQTTDKDVDDKVDWLASVSKYT